MACSRILLALAGQPDEQHVVEKALELARLLDVPLHVVHVNHPHAGSLTMMMEPEPMVTEDDIRGLFQTFGFLSEANEVSVEILTGTSVPKTIAAATRDGDLLAIGHRQKNRFLSAFADTADKHLSDIVACPVLIVTRVRDR